MFKHIVTGYIYIYIRVCKPCLCTEIRICEEGNAMWCDVMWPDLSFALTLATAAHHPELQADITSIKQNLAYDTCIGIEEV